MLWEMSTLFMAFSIYTRLSLYNAFKLLCDQELIYQELMSDLSISSFCRTGVVDTSVILEADSDCHIMEEHLQNMTLTTGDVVAIGQYLSALTMKTYAANTHIHKMLQSKFYGGTQRETIVRRVFEEPLRRAQTIIGSEIKGFGDKEFLQKMDTLSAKFVGLSKSVVHGNFTANNIVLKDSGCGGRILAFGSELSHLGNPIYDVGTIVGDMFVWYYIHEMSDKPMKERDNFCSTIRECIIQFLSTYIDRFFLLVEEDASLANIKRLAAGYAGVSVLFRAAGNDWNKQLPIGCGDVRDAILACGYRLIDGFEKVETFSQLVSLGLALS
ncbi:uncharacterized protein [Watersipora subatra]|uniref:uncharacterized protein isoform X2 n=1 Tax=Watersipora subatra TaxID=2589382 RepID=UPI00355B69D0